MLEIIIFIFLVAMVTATIISIAERFEGGILFFTFAVITGVWYILALTDEPIYQSIKGDIYNVTTENKEVVSIVVYPAKNGKIEMKQLPGFVSSGTEVIIKDASGWYRGIYFSQNKSLLKFEYSIEVNDEVQSSKQ